MAKKKSNNKKPSKNGLQTTTDGEILRLRMRLNKKQEYIVVLELELFNTQAAVQEFSLLYNETILAIQDRLQYLRRLLYDALTKQNGNGSKEETEDFSEENEEEFTYEDRQENGWRKVSDKPKKNNPKTEEEIRVLFRDLAKRFHPDLTNDPEEKKRREEIMTHVNQAYSSRDLKALQLLAEQPDSLPNLVKQTKKEEIAFLKVELKRLDNVITDLKGRILHLEETPAWRLKMEARLQRKSGSDMLSEMANELKEQIDELEERLTVMDVAFEQEETQEGEEKEEKIIGE